MMCMMKVSIFVFLTLMITMGCYGVTNPNDLRILNDFRKGLKNPKLLKWPDNGNDPCGPPSWSCVYCSGGRVTQIQTKNLGLEGSLPPKYRKRCLDFLPNRSAITTDLIYSLKQKVDLILLSQSGVIVVADQLFPAII